MKTIGTLLRRNLRIYWRDPLTVLFSVLAPITLFVLFVVFYRNLIADTIMDSIPTADRGDAFALCDEWLFASVTNLATFAASLAFLTAFVEDRSSGRFSDYLVSPVRRWQLAAGYVLSSLTVSVVLSTLVVAIGQGWALVKGQPLMSASQDLRIMGGVLAACLLFSTLNTLVVTFTSTSGSFGGYSVIMGVAMGFLSFCYVPPVQLTDNINSFLSALPFAQIASLLRTPAMEPAIDRLTQTIPDATARDDIATTMAHNLGMHISVSGHQLSSGLMVALVLSLTVVLAVAGSWRMGRVIR